jgi:hypothetical protein
MVVPERYARVFRVQGIISGHERVHTGFQIIEAVHVKFYLKSNVTLEATRDFLEERWTYLGHICEWRRLRGGT